MKRIALCIGNDQYKIMPSLSCACADAKAVSEKLELLGFETKCYVNLDRTAFITVVSEFEEVIDDFDAAIFYYAGHGFQIDGDNILAPIDLNTNAPDKEVKMNAFPLSELTGLLNQHLTIPKVLILDACRTDFGVRSGKALGFGPVFASPGSLIAFSTSPGQASSENTKSGHGKYTETLLEFMELPRVPIETVFKKTRERLALRTRNQQISWEHTSLIGDFYLNPDSVYDGTLYSEEAVCDALFRFQNEESQIKIIVDELKSYNWDIQTRAISKLYLID
ncbi:MAG: caspase family protein, partial [Lachnospiraceae bacterium]|nr:caspase family protein [Lachnospiraceae bacterium]